MEDKNHESIGEWFVLEQQEMKSRRRKRRGEGINSWRERERGGRSGEMIPLSNPLDTRLVWLPTGSERETEAGGRREQRETEKPSEREKIQDEGKRRKEGCLS